MKNRTAMRNAALRWIDRWGSHYAPWNVTLLGDDLYSKHSLAEKALKAGFHVLFVCKPSSHSTTYEWIEDFERSGLIKTLSLQKTIKKKRGKKTSVTGTYSYRFMEALPLRNSDEALTLNWLELTVTDEAGKILYCNAWVTDHPVTLETVANLALSGRARWKIENENNQMLKIGGYHLEHNFGHGETHLSNVLASMNILAFLLHTAFEFIDERYRTLRFRYGPRATLFQEISFYLRLTLFENWDHLIDVMFERLRVDTS